MRRRGRKRYVLIEADGELRQPDLEILEDTSSRDR